MKKIKILHIQVLPILSGVQNISLDILHALDSNKYDKYLICSEDAIETINFSTAFADANVNVIRLKSLKRAIGKHDIRALIELYRTIKRHKFDIVHTHSTKPGILGRLAARLAGTHSIIHTIHGVAFHKKESFIKRLMFYGVECMATLFGHYLTSVNGYYRRYFRFVSDARFKVIYNGVNTLPSDSEQLIDNKSSSLNKIILFLSRLERAKDPLTLLKAVNILINEHKRTDFELIVAGDGELMNECLQYVQDNKLVPYVNFLGWVNDKSPIYQSADIFCVPSIFEAFGLVFAEAGVYGVPAVATTVEGIPEVVLNNETGLLVEPSNPKMLAAKLKVLLDDSSERFRLGRNAQKHVIENFSKKRMTKEYEALYKQSLN